MIKVDVSLDNLISKFPIKTLFVSRDRQNSLCSTFFRAKLTVQNTKEDKTKLFRIKIFRAQPKFLKLYFKIALTFAFFDIRIVAQYRRKFI